MKPEAPKAWVWLILGAEHRKEAPEAASPQAHEDIGAASFALSVLKKKACDMEGQRFRALHV